MSLAARLTLALALLASPVAAQTADSVHRLVGPSADLAHEAEDAWRSTLAATRASDDIATSLFAFAGASRLAAGLLARHEGPAEESRRAHETLDVLARRVQRAIDTTTVPAAVETAWNRTRKAHALLQDTAAGIVPPASQAPSGGSPAPAPTPTPPPPPAPPTRDPEMPWVHVTKHSWTSGFTPDLMLEGQVEGKNLARAELTVKDAAGNVVHQDTTALTDAIKAQVAGVRAGTPATVNWTYRIDDDELANGENVIRVTAFNAKGSSAWSELKITKRLF